MLAGLFSDKSAHSKAAARPGAKTVSKLAPSKQHSSSAKSSMPFKTSTPTKRPMHAKHESPHGAKQARSGDKSELGDEAIGQGAKGMSKGKAARFAAAEPEDILTQEGVFAKVDTLKEKAAKLNVAPFDNFVLSHVDTKQFISSGRDLTTHIDKELIKDARACA